MAEDIKTLTDTADDADELIDRLESAVNKLAGAAETLGSHSSDLVAALARLEPLKAAGEIPAAAKDAIADVAAAAGDTTQAAGKVIEVPLAATSGAVADTKSVTERLRRGLRRRR